MTVRQTVQRFAVNNAGRDFAVGDIHGCFDRLEQALHKVRFSSEVDRLFSVGDLVDRGPQSPDVLNWLARPWFHAVCGNHDFMTWRSATGYPLTEVSHYDNGGAWLDRCDAALRADLARSLRQLPLGIEVETPRGVVGVVHADFPYDDWRAIHTKIFSTEDIDACLWSRDRYRMRYTLPVRHIYAVIHGHSPVPSVMQLGNVYFIDTGGWREGGRFTLLNLHTLKPAS